MYDLGRRVYVKSLDHTGTISERNWTRGLVLVGDKRKTHRRAHYLVTLQEHGRKIDYLTGSDDLVPADYQCDGCNKWRKNPPHVHNRTDDGDEFKFCFLCEIEARKY